MDSDSRKTDCEYHLEIENRLRTVERENARALEDSGKIHTRINDVVKNSSSRYEDITKNVVEKATAMEADLLSRIKEISEKVVANMKELLGKIEKVSEGTTKGIKEFSEKIEKMSAGVTMKIFITSLVLTAGVLAFFSGWILHMNSGIEDYKKDTTAIVHRLTTITEVTKNDIQHIGLNISKIEKTIADLKK